jgi:hypothetical protein
MQELAGDPDSGSLPRLRSIKLVSFSSSGMISLETLIMRLLLTFVTG